MPKIMYKPGDSLGTTKKVQERPCICCVSIFSSNPGHPGLERDEVMQLITAVQQRKETDVGATRLALIKLQKLYAIYLSFEEVLCRRI